MKGRAAVLVALVVLASVAAAAPATAADDSAEQSLVTMEITVVDDEGNAVGNAEVSIEYGTTTKSGTTRSNGKILFDVEEGSNVRVAVTHPDYVKNHAETFKNVGSDPTATLTMYPKATARIDVTDADGPVEGAEVTVRKTTGPRVVVEGETNGQGVFETGAIEEGEYAVTVEKAGYLQKTSRMVAIGSRVKDVAIEQAQTTVTVRVVDGHFSPPEPVTEVSVSVSDDAGQLATLTTRNSNTAQIPLAVNSVFTVTVNKDRYDEASKRISVGESPQTVRFNVTRTPSLSVAPASDQIQVGQSVTVTVTDEYGNPVQGATVLRNGEPIGQTLSDGTQSVAITSPGEIEIGAEADGVSASAVTVEGFEGATPTPTPTATPTATATATATQTATSPPTTESDGGALPGFTLLVALAGIGAALLVLRRR